MKQMARMLLLLRYIEESLTTDQLETVNSRGDRTGQRYVDKSGGEARNFQGANRLAERGI